MFVQSGRANMLCDNISFSWRLGELLFARPSALDIDVGLNLENSVFVKLKEFLGHVTQLLPLPLAKESGEESHTTLLQSACSRVAPVLFGSVAVPAQDGSSGSGFRF